MACLPLAGLVLLSWGCATEAADAKLYERCRVEGEVCGDGTECREVSCCTGAQCTAACVEDSDCPAANGFRPVCEIFNEGRFCVVSCDGEDAPCPSSFSCEHFDRRDGSAVFLCR